VPALGHTDETALEAADREETWVR